MNPATLVETDPQTDALEEQASICSDWQDRVSRYESIIQTLLAGSEAEFLKAGSRLQDFLTRTREIARLSKHAAELTGEGRMGAASTSLQQELEQLTVHLSEVAFETKDSLQGLSNVIDRLRVLEQCQAGFKRVVRTLRVLAIATRIESARLIHHEAGFNTLADDVEKLAKLIEAKVGSILDKSGALTGLSRTMLDRMTKIAGEQQQSLTQVLRESRESLDAILEINRRSAEVSSSVSMILEEATHQIYEVVTALQSHDITRQQLEHVSEALRDIRSNLSTAPDSEETFRETAGLAGDMCELESSQLENSSRELSEAVRSLTRDLKLVGGAVESAAEEIRGILQSSGQGSESLLARVEGQIDEVARLIREGSERDREMSLAMDSVAQTVTDMEQFLSDIEEIGAEIELIALNARIKAAHTGTSGAALGVLAEEIQRLSNDARGETISVSAALRNVASEARQLHARSADVSREGATAEESAARLQSVTNDLRQLEAELSPLVKGMEAKARDLSEELHEVADGFHHHETVARAVDEVREGLNGIVSTSRGIIPVHEIAGRAERLEKLMARYTMKSERQVHRQAVGVGETDSVKSGSEDFGDNIELF